jgi:acylphosphatase
MKLVVKGRVQGVSYRASMQAKAALHGVDGWVRNLGDGSVEALLQGDEGDVRRVLEWSRLGPPGAEVTEVVEELLESCPRLDGFQITS